MNNYFLIIKRSGANGSIHAIHGFKTRPEAFAARRSLAKQDAADFYRYSIQDSYGRTIWLDHSQRV